MSIKLSAIAFAVSGALFLTACGGGGGGGSAASPSSVSSVISGTAAAGSPIIGKVTVKDSLGAQKTVDIALDGSYRIDVAGMTGPFLFRAAGTVGGRDIALVSAATSADVGNTINITPFTDLIVANIAGVAAEQYFASNPSADKLNAAELSAATTTLTVNPFTGEILKRTGYADQNAAQQVRSWTRFLHTGEALGPLGQFVAGLACLGGLFLVYTGFALSFRRFFTRRAATPPSP